MLTPNIIVSDIITPEMRDAVSAGLNAFNDFNVGYSDRKPISVAIQDAVKKQLLGGAIGRSSLGLIFLDVFYIPENLRMIGLGTKILHMFEDEGRRRGCVSAVLYTISFQAPGFYERNGWQRFGEIPCLPPGTSRIFMTKKLQ